LWATIFRSNALGAFTGLSYGVKEEERAENGRGEERESITKKNERSVRGCRKRKEE